ncbi:MAG: hypothetical protein ABR592_13565 [Nitriliruptorales bacterium]
MESWQVVLIAFFVLLPLVLMLDFWGDERLTARGGPIPRQWPRHELPVEGQSTRPPRGRRPGTGAVVPEEAGSPPFGE